MRKLTVTYSAITAAVALACGSLNAQQAEDLTEAERAEIERQTEQLRERTEQLERQTEELEAQTAELEESTRASADDADRDLARADDADRDLESRDVDEEQDLEERRQELVQTAMDAIEELRAENENAAALYEEAHGYAVFDTTKGGLIVTGAGGTGVAMEKDNGDRTFMHLGQAGIGLGAGLENYKLVLLMADKETYDDFVAGQWDGNISAQAAAGEEGVAAEEQFVDGIRAFRITDAGLMAQIDVSGVRFWASEDLNEGETQVAEAERAERTGERAADEFEDAVDEAVDETEDAFDDAEDAFE